MSTVDSADSFEGLAWETVQHIRRVVERDHLTVSVAIASLDAARRDREHSREVCGDLDLEPATFWLGVLAVLGHDAAARQPSATSVQP